MKNLFFLLFSLFFVQNVTAQTIKDVKTIERKYQLCLDEGTDMLGCTNRFYAEMDKILNTVYNKYSATLTEVEKDKLKTEQKEWLNQRDARIKKQIQVLNRKSGSNDEIMTLRNDNAVFVKQRVLVLIKKITK
jgi:uncharacterized protein YecT (DUF1311 family)